MKRILFFSVFLFSSMVIVPSCNNSESQKTNATDTKESANEKLEAVIPDVKNSPQFVSCKINGQPYPATYVSNAMNLPSRQDFSTRADEIIINGETKLSSMDFSFYTLAKKPEGTLKSVTDFYVQGTTGFPEDGKLKTVHFSTKAGQELILTSSKDGILEGTFSFDVVDDADPTHILKITEGVFKMAQEGKTNLHYDKNGDVSMDSLLKKIK